MSSLKYILFLLLILSCRISYGEKAGCPNARNGIYKVHSKDGSLHTILRTEEIQTETSARTGSVIQSNIKWITDCSFILYNRKLMRGSDSLKLDLIYDTLYNVITLDNGYWETISSTYHDSTFVTDFFRIDTTAMHTDLTELEQFKEYKDGKSAGTFIGYNHVITCVQHPIDKTKYILAFEEAMPVGGTMKYKLLDNVFCTLDSNLRITTVNCRYNDNYDKEIVAMYFSNNKKAEALIIKSWRFNKISMKIEQVPIQKVKYRESDKYLKVWEQ